MRAIIGLTILGLALSAMAQSDLPPKVQADLLLEEISDQIKVKNFEGALFLIQRYKWTVRAERDPGLTIPPPLLLTEAKLALTVGNIFKAKQVLTEYFEVAPQEGDSYKQALALYKRIPQEYESQRRQFEADVERDSSDLLGMEQELVDMGIHVKQELNSSNEVFFGGARAGYEYCDRSSHFSITVEAALNLSDYWEWHIDDRHEGALYGTLINPTRLSFLADDREYIYRGYITGIETLSQGAWTVTTDFQENWSSPPYWIDRNPSGKWTFIKTKDGFSVSMGSGGSVTKYSKDKCPGSSD